MSTLFNISDKIKATYLPFDPDRFVLLVDSEESGVSGNDQFEITGAEVSTGTTFPVRFSPEADPFNFTDVTVDVSVSRTITFPTAGRYFLQIGQPFNRIRFDDGGDKLKVVSAPRQWGNIEWSSFLEAFYGCANMGDENATDVPNLSNVSNMQEMFRDCVNFNQDTSKWDVSNVGNMRALFRNTAFNRDISGWDVSNVTNYFTMFLNNTVFNQDISGWDVRSATIMRTMFGEATSFNQDLSAWQIRDLQDARDVFRNSGMSCENYTDTLVSWFNQAKDNNEPLNVDATSQTGMTFATARSGGANFADAGEARTNATTPVGDGGLGWTISDDIVQTNC